MENLMIDIANYIKERFSLEEKLNELLQQSPMIGRVNSEVAPDIFSRLRRPRPSFDNPEPPPQIVIFVVTGLSLNEEQILDIRSLILQIIGSEDFTTAFKTNLPLEFDGYDVTVISRLSESMGSIFD